MQTSTMHVLVVILLAAVTSSDATGPRIRKCCALKELLNSKATCEPESGSQDEHWPWFPRSELQVDDRAAEALLNETTVLYGPGPGCLPELRDMLAGSGRGHFQIVVDEAGQFRLNATKEGSLAEDDDTSQWHRPLLDADHFCVDSATIAGIRMPVAVTCPCQLLPCVRKCCGDGQAFDVSTHSCQSLDADRREHLGYWSPHLKEAGSSTRLYRFTSTIPTCAQASMRILGPGDARHLVLLPDGALQVEPGEPPVSRDAFCGDHLVTGDSQVLFECLRTDLQTADLFYTLYGVGMVVSSMVLFATVLVQWIVHATYSLNGRLAFTHNLCLMAGFVLLASLQLGVNRPPKVACAFLAFVIQFSFLAAFFWLNVMCIDISWAFSGLRPPQGSATERDRKKFLYYSLYAWGSPTVITIVTAVMEYVVSIPDTYIKPDFGVKACWFKEKSATLAYFYGPMAALLLANFALFVYTSVKIILVQRATRILHSDESGRHDGGSFNKDKKRLMLYGKLFCLMGLTWITEIISWAEGNMKYFWYVTDGINLLRAVFIFIIFCCKPKVFRLLKQRLHSWGLFPSYNPSLENGRSTGTRKSSSSTQQSSLHSLQMTQLGNGGSSHP